MQNNNINNCPLCANPGIVFYEFKKQLHFQCPNCSGIFVKKSLRLDIDEEKLRYEKHNNDVTDKNYQKFVSPIISVLLKDFSPTDKGLDFGAGTGPVISKILTDNNFSVVQYDPFFHNFPNLLNAKYNYIACCEVMEHFYDPKKEFMLLQSLLQPNGKLYCMTSLWDESIDFHKWYYKNDPTHVFIYHTNTIRWIQKEMGFSKVIIKDKLVTFFE